MRSQHNALPMVCCLLEQHRIVCNCLLFDNIPFFICSVQSPSWTFRNNRIAGMQRKLRLMWTTTINNVFPSKKLNVGFVEMRLDCCQTTFGHFSSFESVQSLKDSKTEFEYWFLCANTFHWTVEHSSVVIGTTCDEASAASMARVDKRFSKL